MHGVQDNKVPTMPRYALANDNWGGRLPKVLRNLSAGTKRLLPLLRVCLDVTVMQKGVHIPREQKQTGLLGNQIIIPQSSPSQVCAVLPPRCADTAQIEEFVHFVLVAGATDDHTNLPEHVAPRGEYEEAVTCLKERSKAYGNVTLDEIGLSELPAEGGSAPIL